VNRVLIRPFNDTLDDARGILAVDRATFDECPYTPEQIVHLLTEPCAGSEPLQGSRVWVAEVEGSVAGFVAAFATRSLSADGWEVDLLAVHPRHQGQGLGAALVGQAVAGATGSGAARARAVTEIENRASCRAFEAAGFRALPQAYHLLRCDVAGAAARPPLPGAEAVRSLAGKVEVQQVLQLAPTLPRRAPEVARLLEAGAVTLLAVVRGGRVAAFVELLRVQTLLYAGAWLETLVAPQPADMALLIAAAVEQVRAEGQDELGCLVAAGDWRLHHAFIGQGFASLGQYWVMVRDL